MPLVIFDCDGTLVDSQSMIVGAMAEAFRQSGLTAPDRSAVLSTVGLSPPEAMRDLVPDASDELITALEQSFRASYGILRRQPDAHEPFYPHLLDTLHTLHARDGHALGIATGKSRRGVLALLDRHDLHAHFATIQTADDNPSKPSPVMLERALSETGCEPVDAVMIGDTVYDITMARAAGVRAIGVSWGYHPEAALVAAGAHAIVTDGTALLAAIDAALQQNR